MLRVRPIVTTPRLGEMRGLLTELGLVATDEGQEGGHAWVVLDAGKGRVELREAASPLEGSVTFAVEVRDPAEFARRTVEAGGDAMPEGGESGSSTRITGRDGFSFRADPTTHGATCADADSRLTVRITWLTPDVPGAAATLAAIGARSRDSASVIPQPSIPSGAESEEFIAKNGGVLAVAHSSTVGNGGLAFEYDGDLVALAARLTQAGASVATTPRGLEVAAPDQSIITVITAPHAIDEHIR